VSGKKPSKSKIETPFGENLRQLMAERGMTAKVISEIAEVAPSVIADWLSGGTPSNPMAVQKICRALKCDFEWILTGVSTKAAKDSVSLAELFEEETAFSGIYRIEAVRLKRRGKKGE